MSPDPCDARETEPGPGFVLPCRCGAAVERDRLAHQLDTAIQDLARAHGRTPAAERAARGLTQGPHTTTVCGPSPALERADLGPLLDRLNQYAADAAQMQQMGSRPIRFPAPTKETP